jgi:hypothetical protein
MLAERHGRQADHGLVRNRSRFGEERQVGLVDIAGYLSAARANLLAGGSVPGTDAGGKYDDLAFALSANASATYCKRKIPAATERLGIAAQVWEAP